MKEEIILVLRIAEVFGNSMQPTLNSGDLLLYRQVKSERLNTGDIVVVIMGGRKMVKRLIGLPGNLIQLHEGRLLVDGIEKVEKFTRHSEVLEYSWKLKKNEYLVLGDNGKDSLDGRKIGPLESNAILGRVFFRLWPFSRLVS